MKICKHFNECGGCCLQDIPYSKQLELKEDKLKELLSSLNINTPIKPINYGEPWYYRNKMEFSFAEDSSCGLYSKKEKAKVVNIEECLIFSLDLGSIIGAVKSFVKDKNYSVYNKYNHQGFLRNLIIRETKFTGEIMVGLVTSSKEELDKERLIEELLSLKLNSKIKSIYHIINDSLSDAVVFDRKELIYGNEFIKEKIADIWFNVSIDSFYQVNPKMMVNFYDKIKHYATLGKDQTVLDLFCGAGSIGLCLAPLAKQVWGVEVGSDMVKLAECNAKINNIENISFFASDVRRFLNIEAKPFDKVDCVVINPPRSGLSHKVKRAILRLKPKGVLYSSCNPKSLFTDLESFKEEYTLDFIELFDFFPHTLHLETLVGLRPKKS
ncbi:MAG: 23S rRNA (uracil(1939)-C(5))-methyltransferase RlmD [Candidatus Omnitrophica bacterium]|jgi:23S rRNA (uracil-5-)-methyltransferase RumA|nr:23S rRNA (uracil(1939)-C(5))-methyltransferase RlmD [Candidatus Omnitrophota bacterium]